MRVNIHLAKILAYSSFIMLKLNVLQIFPKHNHLFRKEACRSKELMTLLSRPIRFRFFDMLIMHYCTDKLCF